MKNKIRLSLAVIVLGLPLFTFATPPAIPFITSTTRAYQNYKEVVIPKILVPTVVEMPFTETNLTRYDFLVFDMAGQTNGNASSFLPSLFLQDKDTPTLTASISDLGKGNQISNSGWILDNNENTFVELPIVDDLAGSAQVTVQSAKPISTNSLSLLLDNYVALPNTISISAGSGQTLKTVLATSKVVSQSIHFPIVTANKFVINLTYSQPLRITELRFGGYGTETSSSKLRFLAQPNQEYRIYFNPDRRVPVITGEMGNLSDNTGVIKLIAQPSVANPNYQIADSDHDGIPDVSDNCVKASNPDQVDINNNGRGDSCDDFDKDGIINIVDNCPNLPNYNQQDTDGDRIGDVCDGVESRITEKYSWLPWVGIGLASLVVIGLFAFTAMSMKKKTDANVDQIDTQK
jgi:hypothetical protein